MAKSIIDEVAVSEVKLKKYFYALRNVLAAKWIRENKEVPPMQLSVLSQAIKEDIKLHEIIDYWLKLKAEGDEGLVVEYNDRMNAFLLEEMEAAEAFGRDLHKTAGEIDKLDRLFRDVLKF